MSARYVARVLFHKTPCCQQDIALEYPADMRDDELYEMPAKCDGCGTTYRVRLTEFRRRDPKRASWFVIEEKVNDKRADS